MKRLFIMAVAAAVMTIVTSPAEARRGKQHHRSSCDGIHRCLCGSTQTAHFNLPRIYNGHNLWQAAEWPRAFPKTTARSGVVMYQHGGGPTGHVSRLISEPNGCMATVADDRGRYERNICIRGAIFLDVSGNISRRQASAGRSEVQ